MFIIYYWIAFAVSLACALCVPSRLNRWHNFAGSMLLAMVGFVLWPVLVFAAYRGIRARTTTKRSMSTVKRAGCEHCVSPDGEHAYPEYGLAPHQHTRGSPQFPRKNWPSNFREDKDAPGLGVYWCPFCGDGKPND